MTGSGMHIGLDLGTVLAKVAARGGGDWLGVVPGGDGTIPAVVAYPNGLVQIGKAAVAAAEGGAGVALHGNLKALLAEGGRSDGGTGGPAQATVDFLSALFGAVRAEGREVRGLVATVPEHWLSHGGEDGPGLVPDPAATLRRILVGDLGLPLARLLSEPLAVAASTGADSLAPADGAATAPTHLLVCDLGASAFQIARCALDRDRRAVRMLDCVSTAEPRGDGPGGVALDRSLARLAHRRAGRPASAAVDPGLVRAAGAALRDDHERASAILRAAAERPIYRAYTTYRFGGTDLTAAEVLDAFAPIAERLVATVGRLQAGDPSLGRPAVVVVGGLARFQPARAALCGALGIDEGDLDVGAALAPARWRDAAARGAALVADGTVGADDHCPDEIGLRTHRVAAGRLVTGRIPIAAAGALAAGGGTVFAEEAGVRLVVEVREGAGDPSPFDIRAGGRGDAVPLPLAERCRPPAGTYHVGLRMTRAGLVSAVFAPVGGGQGHTCPLGDLRRLTTDGGSP